MVTSLVYSALRPRFGERLRTAFSAPQRISGCRPACFPRMLLQRRWRLAGRRRCLPLNERVDRLRKSGRILYTYATLRGPGDLYGALIDLPEQRTVIHDVPQAVADLLKADIFSLQDLAQEGLCVVQ